MPLAPSAPYDSLATVTSQVRTLLGDYIQGINPNVAGTVNTNGTAVTWGSGNQFTYLLNGSSIVINGVSYKVAPNGVNSATSLTLVSSAGVQAGVAYSAVLPTGDIFADSQAYVLPTVNLAWRTLQAKLETASESRTRNETVLYSLPVAGSLDPATQQYISWTNFFDGVNLYSPAAPPPSGFCPVLPQDFLSPLEAWERQSVGQSNVVNPMGFVPMSPSPGRLPSWIKGSKNGLWDWREDALYLIGSILPLDLRLSYRAFLPDIAVTTSFASTPVPIMRSADALAAYSAAIFVKPRGAAAAAADFMAQGDLLAGEMNNRQAKRLQFANIRRRAVYTSRPARRGNYY